jgi:hypothetical protein
MGWKNCETCHGSGTEEYWNVDTEMNDERNCTSCGGSGQVEEDEMADMAPRTGTAGPMDLEMDEINHYNDASYFGNDRKTPYGEWIAQVAELCEEQGVDYNISTEFWREQFNGEQAPAEAVQSAVDYEDAGESFRIAEPVDRYRDGEPVDPRNQREGKEMTEFDKFMDRTLIDERQREKVDRKDENNPQRQRAARYQDRPMNKTRFVRGGR